MDVVKICEVVDGCEDCPKYGDDCDGDKMTEHTDYISRADAICEVLVNDGIDNIVDRINALPSAKYITEKPNDAVKAPNDVINRADAKKAVYLLGKRPQISDVWDCLDTLPSTDAVKVAYICDGRKCDKDCSECFRTLDIEHARDFKKMGGTYYQQESANAVHGWIPCSEMLPKEKTRVLTYDTMGDVVFGQYDKGKWYWEAEACADYWAKNDGVIAWTPLPKPYKGGAE